MVFTSTKPSSKFIRLAFKGEYLRLRKFGVNSINLDAVVSVPNYESEGKGSNHCLASQRAAHPAVHSSFRLVDRWVPEETYGK